MCIFKTHEGTTGTKLSFWGDHAILTDQPFISSNNTVHHSEPTGNNTVHSQTFKNPEEETLYDESKSVCCSIHSHYSSQDIQVHWNYFMLTVSGVAQRHTEPVLWERTNQCSHTISCEEPNQLWNFL